MKQKKRLLAWLLVISALLSSCQHADVTDTTADTNSTTVQEIQENSESDMNKTEINKICTAAEKAPALEIVVPEDNTRAVPTTSSIDLTGYISDMVNGNIQNWALSALADNPNIIEQIEKQGTHGIQTLVSDAFGQLGNGLFSINIDATHGYDGGKAIQLTSNKTGTYGDIDYKIASFPGVRLDWTGAKEAWFYVDASEYGTFSSRMSFAIQEKNTDENGNLTSNYESWGLRIGSTASIYDVNKASGWEEVKIVKSASTDWNGGRVTLPAGFKGWVCVTLDAEHMNAYWASNGYNDTLDLKDVNQFQISVEGNAGSIGKNFYMSGFSIVGDVNGGELPVAVRESDDAMTFATAVPLTDVDPVTGNIYTGGIMPWYDEFPGKLLTGMAFNYAISPTEELLAAGNELADALKNAQKEDGYLGIYDGNDKFGGQGRNWDVWGHYHMIYGLLCWYRYTGNEDALNTAVKGMDCVYNYFVEGGRTFDSAGEHTMNLGISHVFAEMYKQTGDQRYLDTAIMIVEEDWPKSGDWMNNAFEGKDYYESSLPRWEALHTVITLGTLYEITGTEKYYTALEDIWWSIAKTDRHNTGGFTSGEAACGDPYNTGAIETCCTIAWMALSSEYLQMSRNSLVADELELSYFNGMIGSLLEGERYVTYNTPMEGVKRIPSQTDIAFQYNSGSPEFNCCQANASRGMGELSQWALLTDGDEVYLNFYSECVISGKTPAGQALKLTENTVYPLDGAIRVTLDMAEAETFTLALRIPSWAAGSTVTVVGETYEAANGEYYRIEREWKPGDVVEISLGMSFHAWTHEQTPTKASVYYGPILLAAEGAVYTRGEAQFSYKDFANSVIRLEDDGEHWLSVTIKNADGREITFYDFASTGKFSSYSTWFVMDNVPARISWEKGSSPIWSNTLLH